MRRQYSGLASIFYGKAFLLECRVVFRVVCLRRDGTCVKGEEGECNERHRKNFRVKGKILFRTKSHYCCLLQLPKGIHFLVPWVDDHPIFVFLKSISLLQYL